MPLERYDDMEPEKERQRRKRSTDIKVATVMILLFFRGIGLMDNFSIFLFRCVLDPFFFV